MHVKTLILGGGLAGLSTAYHLEQAGQTDYLVLEKENEPGGLCKSIYASGFTFDYSGHLLHLHTQAGKALVRNLLGHNLRRLARRAWIYTGSSRIPFPFQANLHALPPSLRQACTEGLLQLRRTYKTPPKNFEQWCLRSFGKGIYEAFMRPYNTKLWGRALNEMTCGWCKPFIPVPSRVQIRHSVVKSPAVNWGYNAFFYYPKQGGCGALVRGLSDKITHLQTHASVSAIDLRKKTVRAGGKVISFDNVVNTLPLPLFLRLLKNEPELTRRSGKLAWQAVTVYLLALKGKAPHFSWIYCPDSQDPFYRVGLQSGFAPGNAPKGCFSLYVELPGKRRAGKQLANQIRQALLQKGIISSGDKEICALWQYIPYAYVVYDKYRDSSVRYLLGQLEKRGCYCAGRYGRWEYSFMERALLQGREIAKRLTQEVC